jgi:GNAT superfamily N-acetyltransferase
MAAFRVREVARSEEFAGLLPLFREALRSLPTAEEDPPDEEGARLAVEAAFGDPALLCLLAEEEGSAAGFLLALPWSDPFLGKKGSEMRLCFVRPHSRRQGVAASLVARAERILAARGVASISLLLPTQDDPLVSIAERHGYVRVREWLEKDLGS